MKMKLLFAMTAIGLTAVALAAPVQAQQDKTIFELGAAEAKQTSKDFKPAPAKIKTDSGRCNLPVVVTPPRRLRRRSGTKWIFSEPHRHITTSYRRFRCTVS